MKFWPLPSSSGSLLFVDALATGGLQSRHLDGGVLIVGGDSGVADLHCSNVSPFNMILQYLFATREPQQAGMMPIRCTTARLRNTASARKSLLIGAIEAGAIPGGFRTNFRIRRY